MEYTGTVARIGWDLKSRGTFESLWASSNLE